MDQKNSKKSNIGTNSLFLDGFAALVVGIYQLIQFFNNFSSQSPRPFPLILVVLPIILSIILLSVAVFKQNPHISKLIQFLEKKKQTVLLISIATISIIVFAISRTASMEDALINFGMTGIGSMFYLWLLIFLIRKVLCKTFSTHQDSSSRVLAISLLIIAIIWIFMLITRIGFSPDISYWNVAGVPMMWFSLMMIILMVLIVNRIANRLRDKFNHKLSPTLQVVLEIMLVLAIWLIASFVWIKTPYSNSYFLLGPQPPDGYYLPKSDARLMDLGGQYLIIGGKLETPYFSEKPFYSLFLGLIHFFFGQSYQTVTNIQILFLAFIPVLLYLLGKQLSGKLFGISLAAYAIIKEATSLLFTFKISGSNSRLMMTEVPSALLLILTAYLIFTWIKKEKPGKALPLLAGTVIGVAGFVRSNNLVVIALIFVYLIFIWRKQIKSRIPQLLFFVLGIGIAILPWTIYNQINYGTNPLTWKIQAALSTRFDPELKEIRQEIIEATATLEPTAIPESSTDKTPIAQLASILESSTEVTATVQPTTIPVPTVETNDSIPDSVLIDPSTANDNDAATVENAENGNSDFYKSKVSMVLGHFLNNQIKSLFVLPFQIYPAHPTTILEQEYWKEPVSWDGEMPLEHILAFCVNLILLSLGIATAWKNFRWAGLIPLVIQMSYYLSNALVRTSGSRYLVPVDWVVYLYFLLGIFTLLRKTNLLPEFTPTEQKEGEPSKLPVYLSLAFSLLIGFSLPILNVAFPTLYHNESKEMALSRLPMEKIEDEIGINAKDMKEFYDNPNTVFLYGREIYPAFQRTENVVGGKALTFTLLSPDMHEISIPYGIELTENLPNGEDMIALGCQDPETKKVLTYLVYFVQSDELLWSTSTTFKDICSQTN